MLYNFTFKGFQKRNHFKSLSQLLSLVMLNSSVVMLHANPGNGNFGATDVKANTGVVSIPDANFKTKLLQMQEINTNGDNEIQVSEALAFTGRLAADNLEIKDLKGIEAFLNITELFVVNNNIETIDVSKNTKLRNLYLDKNNLKTLDVSKLTNLVELSMYTNEVGSLDLSKNVNLEYLDVDDNKLTNLDVTKNPKLYLLYASTNLLTQLDLNKNVKLSTLWIYSNNLLSLDLSKNVLLSSLEVRDNDLTALDLSKNTSVFSIDLSNNKITDLNLSSNKMLETVRVNGNDLKTLNIRNGSNMYIGTFVATNNPGLSCITVDNSSINRAGWVKDANTSYSNDCRTLGVNDLDNIKVSVYPNPVKETLNISKVSDVDVYSITGQKLNSYKMTSAINVSHLEKGSYIIILKDKEGKNSESVKVIKQ